MSPASYRAAPPRVGTTTYTPLGGRVGGGCDTRDEPRHTGPRRARASPGRARPPTYSREHGGGRGDERLRRGTAAGGDPPPRASGTPASCSAGGTTSDGRCLARVRCVVDGLRHSAWVDLADLRLPVPAGSTRAAGGAPPRPAARAGARRPTTTPSRTCCCRARAAARRCPGSPRRRRSGCRTPSSSAEPTGLSGRPSPPAPGGRRRAAPAAPGCRTAACRSGCAGAGR